jgi:CheY-like chemotaxis protein
MQADSAQAPPQTGKRILCIEDEKAGHNVTSVVDGEKGLAEALTGNYDVILLDIMLPNMTGIEILKELRKKKPDLRSKVIIATNLEQSDENRAEIEKQADAYVIKAEVTPRQLVEFLNQIKV